MKLGNSLKKLLELLNKNVIVIIFNLLLLAGNVVVILAVTCFLKDDR